VPGDLVEATGLGGGGFAEGKCGGVCFGDEVKGKGSSCGWRHGGRVLGISIHEAGGDGGRDGHA
jgi:hypothetical protein